MPCGCSKDIVRAQGGHRSVLEDPQSERTRKWAREVLDARNPLQAPLELPSNVGMMVRMQKTIRGHPKLAVTDMSLVAIKKNYGLSCKYCNPLKSSPTPDIHPLSLISLSPSLSHPSLSFHLVFYQKKKTKQRERGAHSVELSVEVLISTKPRNVWRSSKRKLSEKEGSHSLPHLAKILREVSRVNLVFWVLVFKRDFVISYRFLHHF